jgi:hypothetical protein
MRTPPASAMQSGTAWSSIPLALRLPAEPTDSARFSTPSSMWYKTGALGSGLVFCNGLLATPAHAQTTLTTGHCGEQGALNSRGWRRVARG